ncbi:MAG: GNAT family N-acetyltransferase [Nocardioides sp.]
MNRDRLVEQAETALARLAEDRRDQVARGSLHEALADLERLLDGEPELKRRLVDDARREHLSTAEPPLVPIRTERLLLRRREPGDTADLHAIYSRDDVATYLLHEALTLAELEERWARQASSGDEDAIGFVVELDGRVVGQVALIFHGPLQGELAWTIHPDVGGRGIATEAARALLKVGFGHYGLHRVKAELDPRNTASMRLCERLGMRRESHRLSDFWSKGEWTDTYEYAVLASEWAAREH